MRKNLPRADFEVWVVVLWMLWNEICHAKHSKGDLICETNITRAATFLEEFQKANMVLAVNSGLGVCLGDKRWIPPRFGVLRLDVDAMFQPLNQKFGVGVVLRNHLGIIVAASTKQIMQPGNVLEAEILAILHGIALCIHLDLGPVEIYTDSIHAARTLVDKRGEHYAINDEQRKILSSANFILSINHAFRSANFVAHSLAVFSTFVSCENIWTSAFPTWLCNLASHDFEH